MHIPNTASKGAAVSAGMRAKARSGFVVGAARIGYVAVRMERGVGVVPDPITAPLLAVAFGMASRGQSLREIAGWLRAMGVRGKRGDPVSLATVQRTLTDPYYAGPVGNGAGHPTAGRHGAIVSQELFEAVQRRLLARRCYPLKA